VNKKFCPYAVLAALVISGSAGLINSIIQNVPLLPAAETLVAPRISYTKLNDLIHTGKIPSEYRLFDVRPRASFLKGTIPHSENTVLEDIPRIFDTLSPSPGHATPIILFCDGPSCDTADEAAKRMDYFGFTNISVFTEGYDFWALQHQVRNFNKKNILISITITSLFALLIYFSYRSGMFKYTCTQIGAALFIGIIFIYTGFNKLLSIPLFITEIKNYAVLTGWSAYLIPFIAAGLPFFEIIIGIGIIYGKWQKEAAWCITALMIGFLGLLTYALARNLDISCGCGFTDNADPIDFLTVARDGFFIFCSSLVLLNGSNTALQRFFKKKLK